MAAGTIAEHGGLVSKTLVKSPVTKWIFQAHLRNGLDRDILCIGEYYVTFNKVTNGRITTFVSLSDFGGSRIQAARILSEPSVFPNTLVLTLDCFQILLLTLKSLNSRYQVLRHLIPLPNFSAVRAPGAHLAVEPRAVAVAGMHKNLMLFRLRPSASWHDDELQSPTVSVCSRNSDSMMVLDMEFLSPSPEEPDKVVLLVIGVDDAKIVLATVSWDASRSLNGSDLSLKRFTLPGDVTLPLRLVPLITSPGSFLIVCNTISALYVNAHIDCVQRQQTFEYPEFFASQSGNGMTLRNPSWTAWCRGPQGAQQEEKIYLAREDGRIACLKVDSISARHLRVTDCRAVAALRLCTDRAFCVIDTPLGTNKEAVALAVGGNACNGGIFITIDSDPEATAVANAEELNAIRFQTLEDWTPMTDLCVLKAQQDDGVESVRHAPYAKASLTYETPDRVFFTSGKTPHGCISELRSGYRLELSQRIVVDDFRGVHRMVSFRLGSQPLISLLLSFPYQTLLVHDPFGVEELSAVAIADEPLLATAQYKDNSTFDELILVFPSSITILATGQSRDPTSVASIPSLEDKAIIPINHTTAAVIDVESRLIIVAETTETGSHIQLKKRDSEESSCTFVDIGPGVSLGSEVTSMTLLRNAKSRLISMAVATADGMLYFYTLDDLGQSRNIVSLQARLNAGDDQPAACESLCVMRYQTAGIQENNPLLLCGRRDGMLDVVDLETDATEIGVSLSIRDTYTMGSGPLSVYPDEGNPGGAFVFCDSTACYVELPKRTTTNQVRVTGIWTSDPDDSSLKNEPVSAFCQLSNLHPDDDADRSIMMLFGSTLVLASIKPATAPELVLRRLPLRGTPTRIMYSESLKRLVVASTVFHTSNNESYSKRYALSSIQLVDPDSGASLLKDADGPSADSAKTLPASLRSPGQKATSMLEWVLRRDDNRKTIFIVVSAMNTHAARTTGSIVFFKVRKSSGGEFSLQYYQELQEHEPVYSTCLLGDGHSMLYCCGKELRIMKWIPSEKRFRRKTLQTFTSPLRQVSTQDSMIYITTSSSVITIFRFSQDRLTNLQDTGSLTLVKQDNKSRSALSHSIKTPIAEIITSDMHRSIATFSNPHPPDLPSSGAVIEATLPASIVRFACADLRSYRRHNSQISAADWRTIGISADGTITSFAKVDDASWRLLRFLQNLCLRDKRICPVQNRQALRRMHVEPDSTNPRYRHIDGDVLERLVKRADAEELVGEMLDAEVGREMRDYQSTEVRRERFEECASAAGMVGLQAGLDNDGDGREVVREAVRYLRRLLEVS